MDSLETLDVQEQIKAHLKSDDRTIRWLSDKTGIKYYTLYAILKQRVIKLSDERLAKINEVLGTNFQK